MEKEPDIPSTSDQKTIFLVNTFIIDTVRLLNNVAIKCENKLADVHRRIVRVDATLSLLEVKLRSIDEQGSVGDQQRNPGDQPASPVPAPSDISVSSEPDQGSVAAEASSDHQSDFIPVSGQSMVKDDPKYARFFRMLQVGVPLPGVKLQMSIEGLDGSVLDNPEMPSSEG